MLAVDKRAVEATLQVRLLRIQELELDFHSGNALSIGLQAAIVASFSYNGIIEVKLLEDATDLVRSSPRHTNTHHHLPLRVRT